MFEVFPGGGGRQRECAAIVRQSSEGGPGAPPSCCPATGVWEAEIAPGVSLPASSTRKLPVPTHGVLWTQMPWSGLPDRFPWIDIRPQHGHTRAQSGALATEQ